MSYPSFPSIERLENLHCVITEKIDGTNGLIEYWIDSNPNHFPYCQVRFGSRNRYITTTDDNSGFANFFFSHKSRILEIIGNLEEPPTQSIRIYGEWFGKGIQRGYGLDQKYFMPFSSFWAEKMIEAGIPNIKEPAILYTGKFIEAEVDHQMGILKFDGSHVVPGYRNPEGIVIYFSHYNFRLKQTFTGPKWQTDEPKPEHDKKPKKEVEDLGNCQTCGKRLYRNKRTGDVACMNYYCIESPNNPINKKEEEVEKQRDSYITDDDPMHSV